MDIYIVKKKKTQSSFNTERSSAHSLLHVKLFFPDPLSKLVKLGFLRAKFFAIVY